MTVELRRLELTQKRLQEHCTTLRRALVLMSRVIETEPDAVAVGLDTRRRLRELLETLEGATGD
jgi:hypothetical protein